MHNKADISKFDMTLGKARRIVFKAAPGLYQREQIRLTTEPSPVPAGTVIKLFDSTGYHDWQAMIASDVMIDVEGDEFVVVEVSPDTYDLIDADDAQGANVVSPGFWSNDILNVAARHRLPQSYWRPDLIDVVLHIAVALPRVAFYRTEDSEEDYAIRVYPDEAPAIHVHSRNDGYEVIVLDSELVPYVREAIRPYGDWVTEQMAASQNPAKRANRMTRIPSANPSAKGWYVRPFEVKGLVIGPFSDQGWAEDFVANRFDAEFGAFGEVEHRRPLRKVMTPAFAAFRFPVRHAHERRGGHPGPFGAPGWTPKR